MQEAMQAALETLTQAARHPKRTVMTMAQQTGKGCIGCFPVYTPEEIIYAAGHLPVALWGGHADLRLADRFLQGFCCSVMRANMALGLAGTYNVLKAVLIPGFCDTLKCMIENWKSGVPHIPVIGMSYPQMRWAGFAKDYLISEYKRVRKEIERVTGVLISDQKIEDAFALYEDCRAALREFVEIAREYPATINAVTRHLVIKAGGFMDKAVYIAHLKEIISGLKVSPREKPVGLRVVATGYMSEPQGLLEILDEGGVSISGDDLAQASRQFRVPGRDGGSIWDRMANRAIDQRGCTFLCEERKVRGEMLIKQVRETGADAVLVCMMKFCDPEEFDYPVYKAQLEAEKIPHLYIEVDQQMTSFEQIRTRVQSFSEMLGY